MAGGAEVPDGTPVIVIGGGGVGNLGAVEAVEEEWHGRLASATITVPPLGVLWLAPSSGTGVLWDATE